MVAVVIMSALVERIARRTFTIVVIIGALLSEHGSVISMSQDDDVIDNGKEVGV